MAQDSYRQKLHEISRQLVEVQRPILILDTIKWPYQFRHDFINGGGKTLPPADVEFYQRHRPNFDPAIKRSELKELQRSITRQLGKGDALGKILTKTVDQYLIVIDMLEQRGKPGFLALSKELYGSTRDHLRGDRTPIIELGEKLCHIFSLPAASHLARPYPKTIAAPEAVTVLQRKLGDYFSDSEFRVLQDDGIVSDASAGGDCIKVNSKAMFSTLDLQVLEVHEGWVHIGTTLNGRSQRWATWLSVGSPRITATQEGLAILTETLTFSSFPNRARRISDRVIAIDMAEQGASFIDVYQHFLQRGLSEHDSFIIAQRTFRGGQVGGGSCFTKDISYVKGFVETVNFIRSAILSGVPELLPMLFVGKVTLDDIPTLYERSLEGLINQPRHLPPMFRDLNGLYTWFGFSSGMTLVDLTRVQRHFEKLFKTLPPLSPIHTAPQDIEFD
jgi:uncharacterized protein (TIGR02421 family)